MLNFSQFLIQLRLDGTPWYTSNKMETAVARRCMLKLFERFEQLGYILHANSNLDNRSDTLYFRRITPAEGLDSFRFYMKCHCAIIGG